MLEAVPCFQLGCTHGAASSFRHRKHSTEIVYTNDMCDQVLIPHNESVVPGFGASKEILAFATSPTINPYLHLRYLSSDVLLGSCERVIDFK